MAVHLEMVRLDRVFDVQRYETDQSGPRRTAFSFEHAGRKVYGVTVPGWPLLHEGQRFTAALAEPGNWQSFLG
jgi:hypothetical protein